MRVKGMKTKPALLVILFFFVFLTAGAQETVLVQRQDWESLKSYTLILETEAKVLGQNTQSLRQELEQLKKAYKELDNAHVRLQTLYAELTDTSNAQSQKATIDKITALEESNQQYKSTKWLILTIIGLGLGLFLMIVHAVRTRK